MRLLRRLIPLVFLGAAGYLLGVTGVGPWMRWGVVALAAGGGFLAAVIVIAELLGDFLNPDRD